MSKTLRNRFLAFVCFLIFIGVGVLYYVNWVVQKPFGIILFISDGLTPSVLTATRFYEGGADARLTLERFPYMALVSNHGADHAVADGPGAMSALLTGRKVPNGSLSTLADGTELETIADRARAAGRLVGFVTNGSLASTGAAALYAHGSAARDAPALAAELTLNDPFDVTLGGGMGDFLPQHKDGTRTDGRDLLMELRGSGYDVVRTDAELSNTPGWKSPRLFGVFAEGPMAYADDVARAASQPGLSDMVAQAIRLLQFNPKGYLLIVEAALPGRAAASNEGERLLRETLQLDAAVKTALSYAGNDALIIVVGRTNPGALRLNGFPFRQDSGMALLGHNAQGIPFLTWSTGPGIDPSEPVAAPTGKAIPAAGDVLALGVGEGAEELHGFKDNTDIFRLLDKGL